MPPPASYIDITSYPFSQTITQAQFNGGTYGGVANSAWLRVTISGGDAIRGFYTNAGGTFVPKMELYASDGTTLHSSHSFASGWWQILPNGTYYIRVVHRTGGPSNFDFTVSANTAAIATLPLPAGSLLINDDSVIPAGGPYAGSPFPATAYLTDGTFLGFVPNIPAGETGDTLPSGISLIHSGVSGGNALTLYSSSLSSLGSVSVSGVSIGTSYPSIANDGTQFYVMARPSLNVYTVSDAGAVSGPIATLTGGASGLKVNAIGISRDGSIAYYTRHNQSKIYRHNLTTNTAMSDLFDLASLGYTFPDDIGKTPNGHPGEILVLSDGSIVTSYSDTFDTAGNVEGLLHLDASGTVLHQYEFDGDTGARIDHIHYTSDYSATAINAWFYIGSAADGTGRFGRFELSSGTFSTSFDSMMFSDGQAATTSPVMFGPSSSCFMLTLGYAPSTGTIQVVKATVPAGSDQSFSLTAGGGLTPDTFSLSDGEDTEFADVPAGDGYSIAEDAVTGWSTSISVSNGSDPDNIAVAAGETVIVTVTNTQTVPPEAEGDTCCSTRGPAGAPTSTGYSGTGQTGPTGTTPPTLTPRVIPPGGAAPSYSTCSLGGGRPATAANPTDAQSLVMVKTPLVHMKWTLPDGSVRRYGKFDDGTGGFTSGNGQRATVRVMKWGGMSQVLSDRHGSFQANQFTITLSDTDRAIRKILSSATTKYVDGKEIEVLIESAANAALGVTPLVLARGVVTGYKFGPEMTVDLTVTDPLGYRYSAVSIDRPIPARVCRKELFSNLPEETTGRPQPIPYGELSDDYAWTQDPARIPAGVCPVIYVGPANSISGSGIPGGEWEAFLVAGCAISCVASVFASNLLESPGSVRMPTSTYGSEFLVPGINVPKYYDITGSDGVTERVCLLFATGERAQAHISGQVPITLNMYGIEDVGDGSGDTITEIAFQLQHFLSYFVVQNYLTGNWGSVPAFGDGTAKVRTSSFSSVNDVHAARLGTSLGYIGGMYIGDSKPARDWAKEFQLGGDMRLGVNHQGQLLVTTLDHTQSTSGLTTYTDRDSVIRDSFHVDPQVSEIFNVLTYEYGVEPATGRKSGLAQTIRHAESISHHGERVAQAYVNRATNRKATADDVANRSLLQSFDAPVDVEFELDLRGTALRLGQAFKVTHYLGVGEFGWTSRNLVVSGTTAYPDEDALSTTVQAEDWHDLLATGGAVLGIDVGTLDESTIG